MILKIDNLTKEIGKNNSYQKILDDISISFKSGEFVCILGESGSGKSTFLNILGGLDRNYSGSVTINDLNIKYIDIDEYRSNNIGFVFQNFNLINKLSIIDNIILPIEKLKISRREKKKRAIELLKKLNIYDIRNKKIKDLSGGQKQRVSIARALISDPLIILADEPTGALDEKNTTSVLEILKEINKEGKLVIVVTHSNKVIDYSTRVITIDDGKIKSDKKIKKVKESNIEKDEFKKNNFTYLIRYGIKNVISNIKRNIFILLASSIGIIGIILSLFIGGAVKGYISNLILEKTNPTVFSINRKDNLYNNMYYSNKEINDIKGINHIKKVYKEVTLSISNITYKKKDYPFLYLSSFDKIDLEIGDSDGLVISKYLYKKLGKESIGKDVNLKIIDNYNVISSNIKITGVLKDSNFSLVNNNYYGLIKYSKLKEIYNENLYKLKPNNLSIKIDDINNKTYVKEKLGKKKLVMTNNESLFDELKKYLNIATFVLSFFSSLSLIVSTVMISIIINITVLERVKEIGLLRSIGYSKEDIRYIFSSESIILSFFIGMFSVFISNKIIKIILNLVSNKFSIDINISSFKYSVFGFSLCVLLMLFSSYFPSKKASNYDPINALKYE